MTRSAAWIILLDFESAKNGTSTMWLEPSRYSTGDLPPSLSPLLKIALDVALVVYHDPSLMLA